MKTLALLLMLLLTFFLQPLPLSAQATPSAELCADGTNLLLKGRQMNSAIAKFSVLVKREPNNASYHLMLGNAYTGRLASFACAVEGTRYEYSSQKIYEKRMRIWNQMQDDPNMPLFGTLKPVEPPTPRTPDDEKYFVTVGKTARGEKPTPTSEEQQTLRELADNALRSYARARELSRNFAAKSRARIGYECGWGMLMLYRYGKEYIRFEASDAEKKSKETELAKISADTKKEAKPEVRPILKQAEMIVCFQECVDDDTADKKKIISAKKKAENWQSLAFAHAPDYVLDTIIQTQLDKIAVDPRNHIAQAVFCLRRALAFKREDNQILYQIACVSVPTLPQESAKILPQLHAQNPNALYCYLLAESQFQQAEQLKGDDAIRMNETALANLEAGNRTLNYQAVAMVLPLPKSLSKAWNYRASYGLGTEKRCLTSLFSYLTDTAQSLNTSQQNSRLMRLGVAMMEMGLHTLRQYKGDDLDPADFRTQIMMYDRAFYGFISCYKAYNFIKSAKAEVPNAENTLLAEKYGQMESYWRAWDKALTGSQAVVWTFDLPSPQRDGLCPVGSPLFVGADVSAITVLERRTK